MKKPLPHRSKKSSAQQTARLGVYLAAGLGVSGAAMSTSEAAIVIIDIGPSGFDVDGVNAGVALYSLLYRDNFPLTGAGRLYAANGFFGGVWGLAGVSGLSFANGGSIASPSKFSLGAAIGSSANWDTAGVAVVNPFFQYITFASPDFGPGSYMGFRTAQGNYGWLEVTWDSASKDFQILSGAYEDQVGVAILAGGGAGPAAVPEPGTWAAAALLAGGAAFARWRKRRDGTQKEAA
jgi:hypothetical protein